MESLEVLGCVLKEQEVITMRIWGLRGGRRAVEKGGRRTRGGAVERVA